VRVPEGSVESYWISSPVVKLTAKTMSAVALPVRRKRLKLNHAMMAMHVLKTERMITNLMEFAFWRRQPLGGTGG
jgi:hypothetical protein